MKFKEIKTQNTYLRREEQGERVNVFYLMNFSGRNERMTINVFCKWIER